MVEWLNREQAEHMNLPISTEQATVERCMFCSKEFATHNAFTAHLRWHSQDIDTLVYNVINKSTKPIRVATIQNLANVNFSVSNAIQRLVREGKVRRVSRGYTTRLYASKKKPVAPKTMEIPTPVRTVSSAISDEQMNKLIVATLKRLQPEVYNSVVEEIVENMVRYAVGMSELS